MLVHQNQRQPERRQFLDEWPLLPQFEPEQTKLGLFDYMIPIIGIGQM